jgi:type IV pilus assembly protein PilP
MRALVVVVVAACLTVPARAQSAAAPQPPPPAAGAAPSAAPAAPAGDAASETYSYNPDGRRDPFTSLLGTGAPDPHGGGRPNDGLGGMAVGDVAVRGILQSRGALVAMVQGPDNKTYIVHQGDKLLDGTVKSITPQGIVLIQDVNDPLSLVKQREVSKLLRSIEAVKQ